ncbi:phenylacetic acid degradation-related protein [Heterostelium album PN500]|uniref:Phenylacetic acid degradation-related protein n=1 Tax=Heterostelium pallidum (strain ATCC 26659 / Pp 5 / PN500) TaxID=670386 RepID=D3BS66_HETP5|nr:phenylacetic acid degradation-related protein [Heterostelium album PN500]EFA75803.1 phenylacetic acid degradation-related protein [Heterostelium album PN500]|eukprot:XP_020427937.1 phenylacetic acid degradation-related protein [Heterostelium album PN500]
MLNRFNNILFRQCQQQQQQQYKSIVSFVKSSSGSGSVSKNEYGLCFKSNSMSCSGSIASYSTSNDIAANNRNIFDLSKDMRSFLEAKDKNDMKVTNEQWLQLLRSRANAGLPAHMNFEIISLENGVMQVKDYHMAANGYIHAASLITLADTACGFGCFTQLPKGSYGFTTIELKTNFLGTSKSGELLKCEAKLIHSGRSTQVWDAVIKTESDKTLALFRCTEMILYPTSTTTTTNTNSNKK